MTRKAPQRADKASAKVKRLEGASCEACGYAAPVPCVAVAVLHAHHVVPRSVGGTEDMSNIALLCANCHAITHSMWLARRGKWDGPVSKEQLLVLLKRVLAGDAFPGVPRNVMDIPLA